LICCSKPSSQLPGHFQLSQNDVLWGGFWAWRIKRNRTEPSQGSTVGGEALWYYVELKIPSQRMMCDMAHCCGEGTTCLQFHGGRAQLCFSNTRVPVGKMFESQSVRVAQTSCEKFPLNQEKWWAWISLLICSFGPTLVKVTGKCATLNSVFLLWDRTRKPKFHLRLSLAAESWAHLSHDPRIPEKPTHDCPFVHRTNSSGPVSHKFF